MRRARTCRVIGRAGHRAIRYRDAGGPSDAATGLKTPVTGYVSAGTGTGPGPGTRNRPGAASGRRYQYGGARRSRSRRQAGAIDVYAGEQTLGRDIPAWGRRRSPRAQREWTPRRRRGRRGSREDGGDRVGAGGARPRVARPVARAGGFRSPAWASVPSRWCAPAMITVPGAVRLIVQCWSRGGFVADAIRRVPGGVVRNRRQEPSSETVVWRRHREPVPVSVVGGRHRRARGSAPPRERRPGRTMPAAADYKLADVTCRGATRWCATGGGPSPGSRGSFPAPDTGTGRAQCGCSEA